jgi:hypothetical protein
MKRFLQEPLLHFLLLGAAIFAAYGLINRGSSDARGKIVITQGQVASITDSYILTRQRAPTREELEGLIRDRVREEVYYREALALGMDKDDSIIRRRLQQKMEFVSQGRDAPAEPSDAELQAYLNAHAATFATDPRFSFRQVYLNPHRHGANLARDAERLRIGLSQTGAEANLAHIGDPILLEREINNVSAREVANLFGEKFVAALRQLPTGQWQGPVESGYGAHIVFLAARTEGGVPALDQARDAVRREWIDAQQRDAAAKSYQALLSKYAVVIEAPAPATARLDPVAAR